MVTVDGTESKKMPITNEQMNRLESLGNKKSLSEAEMSEMETLENLAAAPDLSDSQRGASVPSAQEQAFNQKIQEMNEAELKPKTFRERILGVPKAVAEGLMYAGQAIPGTINEASGDLKTALLGVGQGFTGGFGDEATGVVGVLANPTGGDRWTGLPVRGPSVPVTEENYFDTQTAFDQLGPNQVQYDPNQKRDEKWRQEEIYKAVRDAGREEFNKAEKDSPLIYNAAQLVGAILSPVNKIAPTKAGFNLPTAGAGAAQGAIFGLGNSESTDAENMATDTALSAGLGGALFPTIAGVGNVAGKYVPSLAAKAMGVTKDVAEKIRKTGQDRLAGLANKYPELFPRLINTLDEAGVLSATEDILPRATTGNFLPALPTQSGVQQTQERIGQQLIDRGIYDPTHLIPTRASTIQNEAKKVANKGIDALKYQETEAALEGLSNDLNQLNQSRADKSLLEQTLENINQAKTLKDSIQKEALEGLRSSGKQASQDLLTEIQMGENEAITDPIEKYLLQTPSANDPTYIRPPLTSSARDTFAQLQDLLGGSDVRTVGNAQTVKNMSDEAIVNSLGPLSENLATREQDVTRGLIQAEDTLRNIQPGIADELKEQGIKSQQNQLLNAILNTKQENLALTELGNAASKAKRGTTVKDVANIMPFGNLAKLAIPEAAMGIEIPSAASLGATALSNVRDASRVMTQPILTGWEALGSVLKGPASKEELEQEQKDASASMQQRMAPGKR